VILLFPSRTWARPLTQSPELGFGLCLFSSWNAFDFCFVFIVLCGCRHCRSAAVVQWFVRFSARPASACTSARSACPPSPVAAARFADNSATPTSGPTAPASAHPADRLSSGSPRSAPTLRALATITSCPNSLSSRLTQVECVPISSAIRLRGFRARFSVAAFPVMMSGYVESPLGNSEHGENRGNESHTGHAEGSVE
jgi:hypothetical protein